MSLLHCKNNDWAKKPMGTIVGQYDFDRVRIRRQVSAVLERALFTGGDKIHQ